MDQKDRSDVFRVGFDQADVTALFTARAIRIAGLDGQGSRLDLALASARIVP